MGKLIDAIKSKNLSAVQKLLREDYKDNKLRINTESEGSSYCNPLFIASVLGCEDIVEALLNAGADAGNTHPTNQTPLGAAVKLGHGGVLRILTKHGAKLDELITEAIEYNKVADIRKLGQMGVDFNKINLKYSPPYIAPEYNPVLGKLENNFKIYSPLHLATFFNHEAVVSALIEAGADPNQPDCAGKTALSFAIEQGRANIVETLVSAGAKVNNVYKDITPFYDAIKRSGGSRGLECVKALLQAGASQDFTNEKGEAPYHFAVRGNFKQAARTLRTARLRGD